MKTFLFKQNYLLLILCKFLLITYLSLFVSSNFFFCINYIYYERNFLANFDVLFFFEDMFLRFYIYNTSQYYIKIYLITCFFWCYFILIRYFYSLIDYIGSHVIISVVFMFLYFCCFGLISFDQFIKIKSLIAFHSNFFFYSTLSNLNELFTNVCFIHFYFMEYAFLLFWVNLYFYFISYKNIFNIYGQRILHSVWKYFTKCGLFYGVWWFVFFSPFNYGWTWDAIECLLLAIVLVICLHKHIPYFKLNFFSISLFCWVLFLNFRSHTWFTEHHSQFLFKIFSYSFININIVPYNCADRWFFTIHYLIHLHEFFYQIILIVIFLFSYLIICSDNITYFFLNTGFYYKMWLLRDKIEFKYLGNLRQYWVSFFFLKKKIIKVSIKSCNITCYVSLLVPISYFIFCLYLISLAYKKVFNTSYWVLGNVFDSYFLSGFYFFFLVIQKAILNNYIIDFLSDVSYVYILFFISALLLTFFLFFYSYNNNFFKSSQIVYLIRYYIKYTNMLVVVKIVFSWFKNLLASLWCLYKFFIFLQIFGFWRVFVFHFFFQILFYVVQIMLYARMLYWEVVYIFHYLLIRLDIRFDLWCKRSYKNFSKKTNWQIFIEFINCVTTRSCCQQRTFCFWNTFTRSFYYWRWGYIYPIRLFFIHSYYKLKYRKRLYKKIIHWFQFRTVMVQVRIIVFILIVMIKPETSFLHWYFFVHWEETWTVEEGKYYFVVEKQYPELARYAVFAATFYVISSWRLFIANMGVALEGLWTLFILPKSYNCHTYLDFFFLNILFFLVNFIGLCWVYYKDGLVFLLRQKRQYANSWTISTFRWYHTLYHRFLSYFLLPFVNYMSFWCLDCFFLFLSFCYNFCISDEYVIYLFYNIFLTWVRPYYFFVSCCFGSLLFFYWISTNFFFLIYFWKIRIPFWVFYSRYWVRFINDCCKCLHAKFLILPFFMHTFRRMFYSSCSSFFISLWMLFYYPKLCQGLQHFLWFFFALCYIILSIFWSFWLIQFSIFSWVGDLNSICRYCNFQNRFKSTDYSYLSSLSYTWYGGADFVTCVSTDFTSYDYIHFLLLSIIIFLWFIFLYEYTLPLKKKLF